LLYAAKDDCTKTPANSAVEVERPQPVVVVPEEDDEEEIITITPEKHEEKPKRRSIFSSFFDKFGKMIEEGESEDEN